MKIAELNIARYGSLSNVYLGKECAFSDRITIFCGPNEAGKTQIKGFIEQMLFPRNPARLPESMKPEGEVHFSHDREPYLLAASIAGRGVIRQLKSNAHPVPGGVASLFPALQSEGNEVFCNLYSFGLDQLLSPAINNRALSEHLFGAISSGKGIPISSVFNNLDEGLKRLSGKDARRRGLGNVLEEVELRSREIENQKSLQVEFARKYKTRSRFPLERHELNLRYRASRAQLVMVDAVRELQDDYARYLDSKAFVDEHPRFSCLTDELRRDLENKNSFIIHARNSLVGELEALDVLVKELTVLDQEFAQIDPVYVQVLQSRLRAVSDLQNGISVVSAERQDLVREVQHVGAVLANGYADSILEIVNTGAPLQVQLDRLGDVRDDLRLFERRGVDSGGIPVRSIDELTASKQELESDLKACEISIEEMGSSRASFHGGVSKIAFNVALSLLLIVAFGVVGLALSRYLSRFAGFAALSVALFCFVILSLVLVRKRELPLAVSSGELEGALNRAGERKLSSKELREKKELVEEKLTHIQGAIQVSKQFEQLRKVLSGFGILLEVNASPADAMDALSVVSELLGLAVDLRAKVRDISAQKLLYEAERSKLIEAMGQYGPGEAANSDSWLYEADIAVKALALQVEVNTQRIRDADNTRKLIEAARGRVAKVTAEVDCVLSELGPKLETLGVSVQELNDGFIEELRSYIEERRNCESFVTRMKLQFQDLSEEAMALFESSMADLIQRADELSDELTALEGKIENIRIQEAEVTAEESRMLRANPVNDIESEFQSLTLEAEELLSQIRAHALAKTLLVEANRRFEEVHQPALLKLTSEIFSRITHGRYPQILRKESGQLYARNTKGEEVPDTVLSRGTREQLYLSIRLAMITRPDSLDIPLVMDDVMVNADIERAEGLAEELVKLSEARQILYFCAKDDAVKLFQAVPGSQMKIIELDRLT